MEEIISENPMEEIISETPIDYAFKSEILREMIEVYKQQMIQKVSSEEDKANIVKSANTAARLSSKTGSKLEKFLLEKLLVDGYVVEFHKEQMLSNTKLQVDLFLPTINLAIEVDGPSHFSPIWGEETFKKNQKYDEKKNGLLIGKGLGLIRIKQQKDFSTARANLIYSRLIDCLKNNKYSSGTVLEIEDE
jgi:very-short-patch-repair endonuclease